MSEVTPEVAPEVTPEVTEVPEAAGEALYGDLMKALTGARKVEVKKRPKTTTQRLIRGGVTAALVFPSKKSVRVLVKDKDDKTQWVKVSIKSKDDIKNAVEVFKENVPVAK